MLFRNEIFITEKFTSTQQLPAMICGAYFFSTAYKMNGKFTVDLLAMCAYVCACVRVCECLPILGQLEVTELVWIK